MAISLHGCSICGRRFEVKFSFQVQAVDGSVRYYCSQHCQQKELLAAKQHNCSTCGRQFELRYAFQQVTINSEVLYYCSTLCRDRGQKELGVPQQRRGKPASPEQLSSSPPPRPKSAPHKSPKRAPAIHTGRSAPGRVEAPHRPSPSERSGPTRIAILNQKGGTGKTTTAVNLAAGLARAGHWTLLVDLDSQGHVATSLGKKGTHGLYNLFIEERDPRMCTTALRNRLNGIVSDERLASVEVWLARMGKGRNKILKDRLAPLHSPYEFILLDCGPALSLLNINALTFAEYVIIPVSCDFLSLVGVKQMLRTLERVNRNLDSPVQIMGILPTFYDRRNRISDEAVKTLKGYFRDKVLPPIRVNSKIKEAPRHRQTIFEYAPDSSCSRDYERVVEFVLSASQVQPGVAFG